MKQVLKQLLSWLALLVFSYAEGAPLVSAADARRDRYLTAVSACSRSLENQLARGKAGPETVKGMRLILRWLEPLPTTRQQFQRQFLSATREDPFALQLLSVLRQEAADIHFYDESSPGQCQGSQVAYFTPGAVRKEIGMCLNRTDLMGRSVVGFIHESLHLQQFSKAPVKDLLSFPFGSEVKVSSRGMAYTPDPKYVDFDVDFTRRAERGIAQLPPDTRARAGELLWRLDGLKTLYMIYLNPKSGLELVPKKPWVIPVARFNEELEKKLGALSPELSEAETADLRFDSGFARNASAGKNAKADLKVRRLSEGWFEWLQRHPEQRGRARHQQLAVYTAELSTSFRALRESLAGDPKRLKEVDDLFGGFFGASRIMRGLLNFCAEMQANIQSRWLLYLFYRKIREYPECAGLQPMHWEGPAELEAEENIFSATYQDGGDFDKVDRAIERWTRRYISRTQSYGPSFSFLYGYDSFPQIFNPESCGHFRPEYIDFRP